MRRTCFVDNSADWPLTCKVGSLDDAAKARKRYFLFSTRGFVISIVRFRENETGDVVGKRYRDDLS